MPFVPLAMEFGRDFLGRQKVGVRGNSTPMILFDRPGIMTNPHTARRNSLRLGAGILFLALSLGVLGGCAAFHPLNGMPVRSVPAQYRAEPRSGQVPLDYSRLRQDPPTEYRVDAGDLLGIFVEGVLGKPDEIPPVTIANTAGSRPALGYPVLVQAEGTISLPGLPDLSVRGMTLREIRERLHHAYTVENPVLRPNDGTGGEALILVNLQRKRTYHVMVMRQESPISNNGSGAPSMIDLKIVRRNSGQVVQLPAYENDVLHALALTGGFPSSLAENAVYVIRRGSPSSRRTVPIQTPPPVAPPAQYFPVPVPTPNQPMFPGTPVSQAGYSTPSGFGHSPNHPPRPALNFTPPVQHMQYAPQPGRPYGSYRGNSTDSETAPPRPGYTIRGQSPEAKNFAFPPSGDAVEMPGEMFWDHFNGEGTQMIRIPLRVYPGEQLPFTQADIILHDGDIVFVESREKEFFFTGGLLGGGQYYLPQNYDLDLLGAMSIVQSQVNTSFNSNTKAIGGVSALNHDVTVGASKVIILRKTPEGCEIKIKIDLYDLMNDPSQRIIIRPGDYILLQYTRFEAVAAFVERHILEGAIVGATSRLIFSN